MKLRISSFALATVISLSFTCAAHADGLKDLDTIQDQARSLEEFLNRGDLQNLYAVMAADYFGADAFSNEEYIKILDNLKKLVEKHPELSKPLWDKQITLSDFSFTLDAPVAGKSNGTFDHGRWLRYLEEQIRDVRKQSGFWNNWWEQDAGKNAPNDSAGGAEYDLRQAMEKNSPGQAFEVFKLNPRVSKSAAAFLLCQLETNRDGLESPDWNVVKATLDHVYARRDLVWPCRSEAGEYVARNLQAEHATQFWPAMDFQIFKAAKDRRLYVRGATGPRTVAFRGVRPFHALLRDMMISGSPGFAVRPQHSVMSALEGSFVQFVEEDGRPVGYVEGYRVARKGLPERFYEVAFAAPVFRQRPAGEDGLSVYELWLERASASLPKAVKGFVIGSTTKIGDERVHNFIRSTNTFRLAEIAGNSAEFVFEDPAAKPLDAQRGLFYDDRRSREMIFLDSRWIGSSQIDDGDLRRIWNDRNHNLAHVLAALPLTSQRLLANESSESLIQALEGNGLTKALAGTYVQFLRGWRVEKPSELNELKLYQLPFIKQAFAAESPVNASLIDMNRPLAKIPTETIIGIEAASVEVRSELMARNVSWAFTNKHIVINNPNYFDESIRNRRHLTQYVRALALATAEHSLNNRWLGAFLHYFPYWRVEPGAYEVAIGAFSKKGSWLNAYFKSIASTRDDFLADQLPEMMALPLKPQHVDFMLQHIRQLDHLAQARENGARLIPNKPDLVIQLFKRQLMDAQDPSRLADFAKKHAGTFINDATDPKYILVIAEAAVEPLRTELFKKAYGRINSPLHFMRAHELLGPPRWAIMWANVDAFLALEPSVQQAVFFLTTDPKHANAEKVRAYLDKRKDTKAVRYFFESRLPDPKATCMWLLTGRPPWE